MKCCRRTCDENATHNVRFQKVSKALPMCKEHSDKAKLFGIIMKEPLFIYEIDKGENNVSNKHD